MNAFEAAEKNGKSAELQRELEDLFISQNQKYRQLYQPDTGYLFEGDRKLLIAVDL